MTLLRAPIEFVPTLGPSLFVAAYPMFASRADPFAHSRVGALCGASWRPVARAGENPRRHGAAIRRPSEAAFHRKIASIRAIRANPFLKVRITWGVNCVSQSANDLQDDAVTNPLQLAL
jgi:hypothetical protein